MEPDTQERVLRTSDEPATPNTPPAGAAGLAGLAPPAEEGRPWTHPLGTSAGHTRITDQAARWVAEALRVHAMGERVSYDVAMDLAPTPNGPTPVVVVFLAVPSMVIGEVCGEMALIEPQNLTQPGLTNHVAAAIARVLAARAQSGRR